MTARSSTPTTLKATILRVLRFLRGEVRTGPLPVPSGDPGGIGPEAVVPGPYGSSPGANCEVGGLAPPMAPVSASDGGMAE